MSKQLPKMEQTEKFKSVWIYPASHEVLNAMRQKNPKTNKLESFADVVARLLGAKTA